MYGSYIFVLGRPNWPNSMINFDKWSASIFGIEEAADVSVTGDKNNFLRLDTENMEFVSQSLTGHRYAVRVS